MKNKFKYIIYEARNFVKSYNLLNTQINSEEEQIPYIIPSIIIITFCVELYLKAILAYYNIEFEKKRGHQLDYLFNLLLDVEKPGAYKSYVNIENKFKNKKKEINKLFLYNNLEELLKNENDSFEMWRYHFDDWKNPRCVFPASEFITLVDCLEEECKLLEKN